jgi:hypothetical protein
MYPSILLSFLFLSTPLLTSAQYIGYNLTSTGPQNSTIYDTANTDAGGTNLTDPDVYLNASVHVGEIDILVSNLTAKVNLQAQVLSLLNFNAGVQASIQKVQLTIQNVNARVILEARLENLVLMINDVLNSLDLNPVLATLGQDVGQIVNTTTSALTGTASGAAGTKRSADPSSFMLDQNILYSVNDYSGNTHTNRILDQSGNIVEQYLDNDAHVLGSKVVGTYITDMRFTGESYNVTINGVEETAKEYFYHPIPGVEVIASIYFNAEGSVTGTKVIAEAQAGGTSTID